MKKTRKFISIFAILFAIVLALSVCFFAACGNKDEEEDNTDTGVVDPTPAPTPEPDPEPDPEPTPETVTQVVYLATSSDEKYTTAGDAVFKNDSSLEISMSSDGLTYTVSGTASTMGEAEAEWYATDDVEEGTPYVVIKIAVAEGESIYFENSKKTYTNDGAGKGDFDEGYMFIVCKLSFDDEGVCTSGTSYTITAADGTTTTTYKVSFSGVNLPEDTTPAYDPDELVYSLNVDFSNHEEYSEWITGLAEDSSKDEKTDEDVTHWKFSANGTYSTGILTFNAISGQTIGKDGAGALYTSSSSGSYFMIDLSGLEGDYITIEVKFSANGDTGARQLYVSTSTSTSDGVDSASSKTSDDITTLEYGQSIAAEDTALYLVWGSTNLRIFSIDINLYGDVEPEINESGKGGNEEEEIEYAFYLDFTGNDYDSVLAENRDGATKANVTLDDTGIFTVNGANGSGDIKISIKNGGLNFGGDYSGNVNIKLNLSSFVNENITIGFAAKSNDSDHVLYAYLAQDTNNTTNLATLTLQKKNEDGDSGVLTKELDVTSDNSTLYILCSNKVVMTSFWIIVNETV